MAEASAKDCQLRGAAQDLFSSHLKLKSFIYFTDGYLKRAAPAPRAPYSVVRNLAQGLPALCGKPHKATTPDLS
jgi:hypothetical protein